MKNPLKAIRRRIEYQKSDEKRQLDFWYDLPVNDKYVMLEPGRGEQTSGSMFALLKEIETNPEFEEFIPFFIVTDGSIADAERKIKHYGFKKVRTVKRMTDDYFRMLATCKYFFSDNTYPAEFCKKPDQILANTWHGTPLKKMGTANIDGGRGLGNVQRNYFTADYALIRTNSRATCSSTTTRPVGCSAASASCSTTRGTTASGTTTSASRSAWSKGWTTCRSSRTCRPGAASTPRRSAARTS